MIQVPVYSAVRVVDKSLERNGQIGTLVGHGDPPNEKTESAVKFEVGDGTQVIETFEDTSLAPVL